MEVLEKQWSVSGICPPHIIVHRKTSDANIQHNLKDRLSVCMCGQSVCIFQGQTKKGQVKTPQALWLKTVWEPPHGWEDFLTDTHFLCLVDTCQGQPFVGPWGSKATFRPPKVNQAANNKLARFWQTNLWPPFELRWWDVINRSGWLNVSRREACVVFSFDGWYKLQVSSKGWCVRSV